MKKNIIITLLAATVLSSCGEYNKLLKSTDYEYKYEAAKNYFAKGQYNRSATLLNELITILKGGDKAEESLYMLAMSYYNQKADVLGILSSKQQKTRGTEYDFCFAG